MSVNCLILQCINCVSSMYKVFKSYYLWHGDKTEIDFIQIVDCDLDRNSELMFEGFCTTKCGKEIDIYSNSISNKAFNVANTVDVKPLSYKELISLIDLLIGDKCIVNVKSSLLIKGWIDKLYSALLFYDDYIDYKFSKE